jgi:hypothetical protein
VLYKGIQLHVIDMDDVIREHLQSSSTCSKLFTLKIRKERHCKQ